jgi:hypothetical protein
MVGVRAAAAHLPLRPDGIQDEGEAAEHGLHQAHQLDQRLHRRLAQAPDQSVWLRR